MPRKKWDPGKQGRATSTGARSGGAKEVVGSKKEAVRRALQALGPKAPAADIHVWVREHFGIDVPADIARTYKSQILARSRRRRKEVRAPAPAGATPRSRSPGQVSLKDVRVLKELGDRIGRGRLRELLELLS
jgi:hypothetical protein